MNLQGNRILLVEDCPDQQRLYLHYLVSGGAEVDLECDGFAAVRAVRKAAATGRPYDVVVMDLVLEASDGIISTEQILELQPEIAVIAVTSNGSEEIELAWRLAGCLEYLEKPVSREELQKTVLSAVCSEVIATRAKVSGALASNP